MGLVSWVRNSEEIGSIGVLGGIDCTWGGEDAGADSTTGVGVLAAGVFSTLGTRCNVVALGVEAVATDVTEICAEVTDEGTRAICAGWDDGAGF
ncbi:MAG TPA: hypothetical protein VJR03_06880 [Nitrospira sp.]|nr:hypothetical protein [Nitrospira sp.]